MKRSVGGPLALVGEAFEGSSQKEKATKKKKALVTESDDEEGNSEGEADLKSMMKTLALITIDYNRGFRRPFYRCQFEREDRGRSYEKRAEEKREEKDDRRDEKRSHQRSDDKGGERSESKGDKSEGCFKCGKPGHFAFECDSKIRGLSRRRMQLTTKRRPSYILRGLCLLKRMTFDIV